MRSVVTASQTVTYKRCMELEMLESLLSFLRVLLKSVKKCVHQPMIRKSKCFRVTALVFTTLADVVLMME